MARYGFIFVTVPGRIWKIEEIWDLGEQRGESGNDIKK